MKTNEQITIEEFRSAAMPLIRLLAEKGDPMMLVCATSNRIDLYRGEIGIGMDVAKGFYEKKVSGDTVSLSHQDETGIVGVTERLNVLTRLNEDLNRCNNVEAKKNLARGMMKICMEINGALSDFANDGNLPPYMFSI